MKPDRKRTGIALLATALLLAACIPSVNPFYTPKDLVFDARLLGEWQEKDKPQEPEIWKFEKADDKGYKLQVIEKGKTGAVQRPSVQTQRALLPGPDSDRLQLRH